MRARRRRISEAQHRRRAIACTSYTGLLECRSQLTTLRDLHSERSTFNESTFRTARSSREIVSQKYPLNYTPPPTPIPQYPHPPLYPKGPGPMGPGPGAAAGGGSRRPMFMCSSPVLRVAAPPPAAARDPGPWARALWGIGVGGDIGV